MDTDTPPPSPTTPHKSQFRYIISTRLTHRIPRAQTRIYLVSTNRNPPQSRGVSSASTHNRTSKPHPSNHYHVHHHTYTLPTCYKIAYRPPGPSPPHLRRSNRHKLYEVSLHLTSILNSRLRRFALSILPFFLYLPPPPPKSLLPLICPKHPFITTHPFNISIYPSIPKHKMPLPTILFFAGAFADPSCFDILSAQLQKAGYPTTYAYVPSLNPTEPATASASQDAQATRDRHVLPLLDEGKDVVMFTHSYGGVVGGGAAAGLSKASRSAAGKSGGVVGMLYCVGNIVCEGETLLQAVGGSYPPFIKQDQPSNGVAVISPVIETLYSPNTVSQELVSQLEAAMTPTALAAFETPGPAPAWAESEFDGYRTYLRTVNDQCNPSFLQDMWIEKSGVAWDVVDLASGHCPFITQPEEVVEVCIRAIEKWV
ncbi:unnamed protein product [Periconia digitata]|uniref:AB hydrolase-1 domain-containing protein n=1 Tax=Periconia digitata TaxID=1303443 RepID=A0A9W4UFS3_9PLEO|nr:unnamed protein product [Periconia digitata]